MEETPEECACGKDYTPTGKTDPKFSFDTLHGVIRYQNLGHTTLFQIEIYLLFENKLKAELIRFLIALHPRSADARPFGPVKETKLNSGGVCVNPHDPPESVDFAHHVALP